MTCKYYAVNQLQSQALLTQVLALSFVPKEVCRECDDLMPKLVLKVVSSSRSYMADCGRTGAGGSIFS